MSTTGGHLTSKNPQADTGPDSHIREMEQTKQRIGEQSLTELEAELHQKEPWKFLFLQGPLNTCLSISCIVTFTNFCA